MAPPFAPPHSPPTPAACTLDTDPVSQGTPTTDYYHHHIPSHSPDSSSGSPSQLASALFKPEYRERQATIDQAPTGGSSSDGSDNVAGGGASRTPEAFNGDPGGDRSSGEIDVTFGGSVIDLRDGADYSGCGDVIVYVKQVGIALGVKGSDIDLVNAGKEHLQKCMENDQGLFVPQPTTSTPYPPGLTQQDNSGVDTPSFNPLSWTHHLSAHWRMFGDAARMPMEEIYGKDSMMVKTTRSQQKERVVYGEGWSLEYIMNPRIAVGNPPILLTNIRAPMPTLQDGQSLPPVFSPDYIKLITALYDVNVHPVSAALRLADEHPDNVLVDRNDWLRRMGIPAETLPRLKRRGESPWSEWEDEAEKKFAQEHDPKRYQAWEKARVKQKKAMLENLGDHGREAWERSLKTGRGLCCRAPEETWLLEGHDDEGKDGEGGSEDGSEDELSSEDEYYCDESLVLPDPPAIARRTAEERPAETPLPRLKHRDTGLPDPCDVDGYWEKIRVDREARIKARGMKAGDLDSFLEYCRRSNL
ncbi:hypothetical protein IAT38_005663 [Cryptococcus sp. DSM 104549]